MAEISETEFNFKRKDILSFHEKITKFLVSDFDSKFKSHYTQGHKWFIQGTVHGICKSLNLDKQLVVFIILGSNPRRPTWGNLKDKYNIEPIKYVLRREIISLGKAINKELFFKVFFTDLKGNGDFQMKIVFYKKGEEEPKKEAFVPRLKQSSKPKETPAEQENEEIIHVNPTIIRKYADAALRGKDKPDPKPIEDPKKKKVVKAAFSMLAESSSEEDEEIHDDSSHDSGTSKE